MEKDCKKALDQINSKMYTENFDNYRQIMCCGIAFFKKSVAVKLKSLQI